MLKTAPSCCVGGMGSRGLLMLGAFGNCDPSAPSTKDEDPSRKRLMFRGDAFGEIRTGQGDGAAQPLVLIQLGIVGIHVVHNRAGEVRREDVYKRQSI